MNKFFFLFIILLVSLGHIQSQNITSPSDFLGYELGSKFTRHHKVYDYFKTLAQEASGRMRFQNYGATYEDRPLALAYISSKSNMAKLETIRKNHLRQAGLLPGNSRENNVAIVWLSYNVHGNEASSTEAAMLTAFQLLTKASSFLENTVVIIDPCVNPDGRDRYVNWYYQAANQPYDNNPEANEHDEPWPGGRPNHYLFDLNRDWAWATQIETQERLKVYNQWMPHIHIDFHEQGINSPYYFAPAAEPYHDIITDWQREFQIMIGKNHAKYFDEKGWLFFTRERFDLLYPSYGDTYPTFMGAIGMTYEQAGHGRAGLGIINNEGHELTLFERLTHHTTTGISTVEMASQHNSDLIRSFKEFFNNNNIAYKSFVMKGHEDHIDQLKALLNQHRIIYESPTVDQVKGYRYDTGKTGKLDVDAKSLVVHTNQPKGKMVKALFEPKTFLSDSLTYDITAWSLPYAYGLDAVASKTLVPSTQLAKKMLPQVLTEAYGYVCEWNSLKDAQFLAELLQKKFKVRFTEKAFRSNGRLFQPGSLIILSGEHSEKKDFLANLNATAQKHHQTIYTINSGFSETIPDMGSPDVKLVHLQRVALLRGEGTSSLSFGELWHFFEQQLKYPVTHINTSNFGSFNLEKYDVLIMPNGFYGSMLGEKNFKKLTAWIRAGGKVIAIDGALRSFAGKDGFQLSYKTENASSTSPNLTPYAERERSYTNNLITGAIFKTHIDVSHPLAFGYDDTYFTLKLGSTAFNLLNSGYNVSYIKEKDPYSGFAGKNTTDVMQNSLVFGEERFGKGSLVYMVDNPLFRSFWENGKLFLANAIFFVNHNAFQL